MSKQGSKIFCSILLEMKGIGKYQNGVPEFFVRFCQRRRKLENVKTGFQIFLFNSVRDEGNWKMSKQGSKIFC